MAHRGVCPDMACQLVEMEIPKQKSKHQACKVVAEKLGLPLATVRTMVFRNTSQVDSDESKKNESSKETYAICNLHTLTFDSDHKKIVFELRETDGNQFLVMQELKVGKNGKETPTKHRLTMAMDLIPQFQSALDQVEVLIQERSSGESGAVGLDPKDGDEVELPAGDDAGDTQDNEHDGMGAKTGSSPAPADGAEDTTVEAELVQCADCNHFAVKKWAPDENGACNSRSGSWNKKVFQPPNEPHPCPNFSPRDQQ